MYFPHPRVLSLIYRSLNTKYDCELLKMENKKLKGDSFGKKYERMSIEM